MTTIESSLGNARTIPQPLLSAVSCLPPVPFLWVLSRLLRTTWNISWHLHTFSPVSGRNSWKLSFLDDFKLECLSSSHFVLALGEFHVMCLDRISSPRSCRFSQTHPPDPPQPCLSSHSSQTLHHSSEIPDVSFWWLNVERDRTKEVAVVPPPWRSS